MSTKVYYWVLYDSYRSADYQRQSLESYGLDGGLFTQPDILVFNAKVTKTKKGRYRIRWKLAH